MNRPYPWTYAYEQCWPRGWYRDTMSGSFSCGLSYVEGSETFERLSEGCKRRFGPNELYYSPGKGCGILCPKCVPLSYLNEAEEGFYLQWLEDQAEIADAEAEELPKDHSIPQWVIDSIMAQRPDTNFILRGYGDEFFTAHHYNGTSTVFKIKVGLSGVHPSYMSP